jgi:DNA-directed RNA polymerase subunit RPC12/RpoP
MTNTAFSLKCPSCGSALDSPDSQGVSQCSYCGTKIVVPKTTKTTKDENLVHYHELCDVAKQAKNFKDLLKYSNKILEIDSRDTKGWVNKAIATAWLTTEENDRFDEADGYLQQASRISPNETLIKETKMELKHFQHEWYLHLAIENNIQAAKRLMSGLGQSGTEYTIKAMNNYLKALRIEPNDIETLERLKLTESAGRDIGIQWSDEASFRLRTLELLKTKQAAIARLAQLEGKLQSLESELGKLNSKKGFFARLDREDVQNEIKKLMAEIEQLKESANYEVDS